MLKNLFNWTKNNKVATILILILAFLVLQSFIRNRPIIQEMRLSKSVSSIASPMMGSVAYDAAPAEGFGFTGGMMAPRQIAPITNTLDRKVVTNSNFSLQVKSVTESANNIKSKVEEMGGFVINTMVSRPEFGEDASIDVRIPNNKLDEFAGFLRGQAMKVVTENTTGADITDQYVDIQERLAQLTKEKAMLDSILTKAVSVDDIMKVRPYIQQVQNEIDSYKGQLKYMDGTTSTSLVTIFLATDELSLPYAPAKTWRPEVVFKTAVRSLLGTMQNVGSGLIWLGVYSVIIVPAVLIVLIALVIKNKGIKK